MTSNPPPVLQTRWSWAIATFFGAGHLQPGPGTWGSLAAVALWYGGVRACRLEANSGPAGPGRSAGSARPSAVVSTLLASLAVTAAGIPAATRVAQESGREDPGFVVIDEVAGQLLALAAAKPRLRSALLAFGLFRLFDITKPWPARQLEALPAGWGIMLDDLAAGLWALLALALIEGW
jgi:phosphatidylglycerophosphatase A